MILIAESGSTKCDWVLLEESNKEPKRIRTKGLNPAILKKKEIKEVITENLELIKHKDAIKTIYFFGAGCNTENNNDKIHFVLNSIFKTASTIVEEDTMAAVYATTKKPGVVCILGTGSNCCYFNGKSLINKSPSLGYIVMDEGSGNHIGKELLKAYYYNQMPSDLRTSFENKYNLRVKKVIQKLYQSKTPNKYLANFAPFLFENLNHQFMIDLIENIMNIFIKNHILQYSKELENTPLHFVGSVAFHAQEHISNLLNKHNLKASSFIQRPIDNLIEYIKTENSIT